MAGFSYYDGAEVFNKLEIGALLEISLNPENDYDPWAVAIYYKDYKLGFIPRDENRIFYKLLKVGVANIEIHIQRIDNKMHPEEQPWAIARLAGE